MADAEQRNKEMKLVIGYCRIHSEDMNIVDGIIDIIFEYQQPAKWSSIYKGNMIKLEDDESKAVSLGCDEGDSLEFNSVRSDHPIERGQIVSWEFECKITGENCNFYGVVSSKVMAKDFKRCPAGSMANAYGVDDSKNYIYATGESSHQVSKWLKPAFPLKKVFQLQFVADWTEERCKLSIFYQGKRLNDENEKCTILIPKLDDNEVLYPCTTPCNPDAYCIIRYT